MSIRLQRANLPQGILILLHFKVQGEKTKCPEESGYGSPLHTLSASGLSAPPYIAVSGLREEELCQILCPDKILAAKVLGLCKGENNSGNDSGCGWLVFMCGGQSDHDSKLSMTNKKFMHYNHDVYVPCGCGCQMSGPGSSAVAPQKGAMWADASSRGPEHTTAPAPAAAVTAPAASRKVHAAAEAGSSSRSRIVLHYARAAGRADFL